jgi:hypothetical protein
MSTYRITSEVDYIVEAENIQEALLLIRDHTEFPIIGANTGTYCENDRIIRHKKVRKK